MTFARPIDLRAGPTPLSYVFLTVVCLFAGLVALISAMDWAVKLLGAGITVVCFAVGWFQLGRQRNWQVIIYNSGAINIGPYGNAQHPAELGQGSFCSRLFVTLPLRMTGKTLRYFLINPGNNDEDDYRRLRVWLNYSQKKNGT